MTQDMSTCHDSHHYVPLGSGSLRLGHYPPLPGSVLAHRHGLAADGARARHQGGVRRQCGQRGRGGAGNDSSDLDSNSVTSVLSAGAAEDQHGLLRHGDGGAGHGQAVALGEEAGAGQDRLMVTQ